MKCVHPDVGASETGLICQLPVQKWCRFRRASEVCIFHSKTVPSCPLVYLRCLGCLLPFKSLLVFCFRPKFRVRSARIFILDYSRVGDLTELERENEGSPIGKIFPLLPNSPPLRLSVPMHLLPPDT